MVPRRWPGQQPGWRFQQPRRQPGWLTWFSRTFSGRNLDLQEFLFFLLLLSHLSFLVCLWSGWHCHSKSVKQGSKKTVFCTYNTEMRWGGVGVQLTFLEAQHALGHRKGGNPLCRCHTWPTSQDQYPDMVQSTLNIFWTNWFGLLLVVYKHHKSNPDTQLHTCLGNCSYLTSANRVQYS